METDGGRAQMRRRRRGLNRKEEITVSHHSRGAVLMSEERPADKRLTSVPLKFNRQFLCHFALE